MGVSAVSAASVLLTVGGQWLIEVEVRDLDGVLVDDVPSVVVTLPDDTTTSPAVETVTTGVYRTTYNPATAGRYVAAVTASADVADFAAYALAVTAGTGMPDAAAVVEYIGPTSHTLAEVQDALDAEAAAQRSVCRVRAVYPPDLRQALLRRAHRNLMLRQLPLAIHQGDAEAGPMLLPGRDPEVRRLEAPHRKLVMG